MFNLIEVVNGILTELSFYDGTIEKNMRLSDELGIDSLRIVELVVALEEKFNITINETNLDPDLLKTVEDIYLLVNKYIV